MNGLGSARTDEDQDRVEMLIRESRGRTQATTTVAATTTAVNQ